MALQQGLHSTFQMLQWDFAVKLERILLDWSASRGHGFVNGASSTLFTGYRSGPLVCSARTIKRLGAWPT